MMVNNNFSTNFFEFSLAYPKVVSEKKFAKNVHNLLNYDFVYRYVAVKWTKAIERLGFSGVCFTNFFIFIKFRPIFLHRTQRCP
jgi:hypothetical protein